MEVSSGFGRKLMAVPVIDIKDICYYEILVDNDTMNVVCYFEFLKRLLARSLGT